MGTRARVSRRRTQHGFTYVGLLILVALIGIALAGTAEVVSTALQREREQELLFVGAAYADALDSYRKSSPGEQRFPTKLEALVADPRFPNVRRHIRRLYRDPITGSSDWGLVLGPHNGIVGVYSKSERKPLKQAHFPARFQRLANAKHYSDWQFLASALNEGGEDAASYDAGVVRQRRLTEGSDDAAPSSGSEGFVGGEATRDASPFAPTLRRDEEGASAAPSPFSTSPLVASFGNASQKYRGAETVERSGGDPIGEAPASETP